MSRRGFKRGVFGTAYLVVAMAAIGNSGCLMVAAAVAAGGAAGYVYVKGRVCDIYPADLEPARTAVRAAFADLGMAVENEDGDNRGGVIHGRTPQGEAIKADLKSLADPGQPPLTRICVRVNTFGDHPLSEQIHAQVAARLGVTTGPLTPVPVSTAAPPLAGPAPTAASPPPGAPPRSPEPPLAN